MAQGTITKVVNESGENYCKMPDGTLLQYGSVVFEDVEANTSVVKHVQLPLSFYGTVTSASLSWVTGDPANRAMQVYGLDKNYLSVQIVNVSQYGEWKSPSMRYIAVGRWK